MKSKLYLCLSAIIMLLSFSACEKESEVFLPEISYTFSLTNEGVTVNVSPLVLMVGQEISVEASQIDGENIPIVVFSESLGFEETITTPCTFTKKITTSGTHDLNIKLVGTFLTSTSSLDITVYD